MVQVRPDEEELWKLIDELRHVSDRLTAAADKHRQTNDEGERDDDGT